MIKLLAYSVLTFLYAADVASESTTRPSSFVVEPSLDAGRRENLFAHPRSLSVTALRQSATPTIAPYFLWETSQWSQRNLRANNVLNITAFQQALEDIPYYYCSLGVSATLMDHEGTVLSQPTVGSHYYHLGGDGTYSSGWNADTTFAVYSNSKIFAVMAFMAAVVESGLGYLDEPLYRTMDYLSADDRVGKITPRMILSHRSGIKPYNRLLPHSDPLYQCIYSNATLLSECVQDFLLKDDFLREEPGTVVRYNNDPFIILADLLVRKTGLPNYQDIIEKYLTGPMGMDNTTYDCPLVGSTPEKPHVSWGVCSTGNDMPKIVQVLIRKGLTLDGRRILSEASVYEIFNFQTDLATNSDSPLQFSIPLNNCIGRQQHGYNMSLIGYGLGTMITAGVKGQTFVHAGTLGGYWVVSPGRYAAYLAFMTQGAFPQAYSWIARVVEKFEMDSQFYVTSDDDSNETVWNEIRPCVDESMFLRTTLLDDAVTPATHCNPALMYGGGTPPPPNATPETSEVVSVTLGYQMIIPILFAGVTIATYFI